MFVRVVAVDYLIIVDINNIICNDRWFFFYKIPLNLRITTADDIFMYVSKHKQNKTQLLLHN